MFLLLCENLLALPLPQGAPTGANMAQAADPLLRNAITEAYQYGPGIWSNPGKATMTRQSLSTKVSSNPIANPSGSALDRNPFIGSAPFRPSVPPGIVMPNYHPAIIGHNGIDIDAPVTFFGPSVSLGHPYVNALSLWFNSKDVPIVSGNQFGQVPESNLVRLGFFNNMALTSDVNYMSLWVLDFLSFYESLKPANGNDFIHSQSRGKYFIDSIRTFFDQANPADAGNYYRLKKVFTRHNKRFASFRAIGLNPMWDLTNPFPGDGHAAIAPRIPDYILNSYARFFYNESYRHLDDNLQPNALSLVYRTTANMLAYESGHMNMRYPPTDPSCRNPIDADPCVITGVLPMNNRPDLVNFGTPNEFAVVYDVLKFLIPGPGLANQAALTMAGGSGAASVAPVSGAMMGRLGVSMPTDMQTLVSVAQAIFNAAWDSYQGLPAEFGGSPLLAPRASAAFVAAAAIAGKRVDPVFWGHLAEAEQATMKSAFGDYKNLMDSWFASDMVRNDYALSLSDFGNLKTNYQSAAFMIPPAVPFANTGLGELLATARDADSEQMALVRGPAGLMSLQGDRFETATAYKRSDDIYMGTPFPNPYIELAQSGRAIIDGDLIFPTNNGVASSIDIDQVTLSNILMPFENAVMASYRQDYTAVTGLGTNSAANQGALTRTRSAGGTSGIAVSQEQYKLLTGRFKPVSRFSSDSRFFTPALQYWLVISDKLNSTGIDPLATINPPQFANINNMYLPEVDKGSYRIKNLANVSYTDSGIPGNPRGPRVTTAVPAVPDPLGNVLPLDAYHNSGLYTLNEFPLLVQAAFQRTIESHFVSPTNSYIPSIPLPEVDTSSSPNTLNPNVPPSGPASIPCLRLNSFGARDTSVQCP